MSQSRVKSRMVGAEHAAALRPGTPDFVRMRENTKYPARLRSRARLGPSVADGVAMDLHGLVHRVRSEFNEMPGLQLTLPQAARLWGLDHEASRLVIQALVEGSFLRWTARGTVVRIDRAAA